MDIGVRPLLSVLVCRLRADELECTRPLGVFIASDALALQNEPPESDADATHL